MEVAKIALDNDDFDSAIKSYSYVTKEYPGGPYFLQAQQVNADTWSQNTQCFSR